MLHTLKRYGRLYRVLISQFLKVVMQSKVDFLMGLLGFFLTQASGIIFLYLIFQQIPNLQGWTFDQLIFIYGFAQIPRGIDHLFTDNIWLVAWRIVVNGEFDRTKNFCFFFFYNKYPLIIFKILLIVFLFVIIISIL